MLIEVEDISATYEESVPFHRERNKACSNKTKYPSCSQEICRVSHPVGWPHPATGGKTGREENRIRRSGLRTYLKGKIFSK